MNNAIPLYYLLLLLIIYIVYLKGINGFFIRLLCIRFSREKNIENYTVVKRINHNENCPFIVACSLFGNIAEDIKGFQSKKSKEYLKYYLPLVKYGPNIRDKYNIDFPGFNFRIYIGPDLSERYIQELTNLKFEVFIMNKPSIGLSGTFWRFLAFEDKALESIVFMTDTDTLFDRDFMMKRMDIVQVIKDWEKSDKPFLILGNHLVYTPFCANRIGMRGYIIPGMEKKINDYSGEKYGEDELFLKEEIWPIVKREGYIRITCKKESIVMGILITIILIGILLPMIWLIKNIPVKKVKK